MGVVISKRKENCGMVHNFLSKLKTTPLYNTPPILRYENWLVSSLEEVEIKQLIGIFLEKITPYQYFFYNNKVKNFLDFNSGEILNEEELRKNIENLGAAQYQLDSIKELYSFFERLLIKNYEIEIVQILYFLSTKKNSAIGDVEDLKSRIYDYKNKIETF